MLDSKKIYRIDQDNYKFEGLDRIEQKIEYIIQYSYSKYNINKVASIQEIPSINRDGIDYYLMVYNPPEKESDWLAFLPIDLTESYQFNTLGVSLILFIYDQTDLYVVVGGGSYRLIVPFIDHTFGINVLSKIMRPTEDLIISINSKGITGTRSGISEQFRNEFKIVDFVRFGKVPYDIHITLSLEISRLHFSFLQKIATERLNIHVGKAFKIKKQIDFEFLHMLILELGIIRQLVGIDYLSSFVEVRNRKFKNETLHPLLMNSIYNDSGFEITPARANDVRFKFDFCHPNKMVQFYESDNYTMSEKSGPNSYTEFDSTDNRSEIYSKVLRRAISEVGNTDFFQFRSFIQGVRIRSYIGTRMVSSANFQYYFTCEFNVNNSTYFLIDTKWYRLKQSFLDELDEDCVQILRSYKAGGEVLFKSWNINNLPREDLYNMLYDEEEGYIVIDKIVPDNIELCDIIHYNENELYLIHVKKGFDASMRDLTNQILISQARLFEDLNSDSREFLKKVYEQISTRERNNNGLSEYDFLELFTKNIKFVYAFVSTLREDRLVEDNIGIYKSNIAKYSLIDCHRQMRSEGYELEFKQIRRN